MDNLKKELISIAGEMNVFDDDETLKAYRSDKSFEAPMKPWFVTKPQNSEQVQGLVKWANETGTPLVPVSSGPPHYKGDTVPSMPQAVIVDLSGMKKILSINRKHRIAVIEPGVTYEELQAALEKEGMTISASLAPRAGKSVLASVLEVEPRLNSIHQWNYTDPLRCIGVVWGDGISMYTGEAGMGLLDLEKQWASDKWQVSGTGPQQVDFCRLLTSAQGTMGIAAWISIKCEILPQIHNLHLVPAEKSEDLKDFVYRVLKMRFSDELMVMNGVYLANLIGETASGIKDLQMKLPKWVSLVGIAGREILAEEYVDSQEADIAEIAQQFGLKMLPSVLGAKGSQILNKMIHTSGEKYWKETYKGAFQEIFFVTTINRTSEFIDLMYSLADTWGYPSTDIGVYIQPLHAGTSCHCEFHLPYDPGNMEEVENMRKFFKKASEELAAMGAYYSRPYGIWSKIQLNKDAQSLMMLKRLKGIFDPNHIMNPGKLSV